ncbi:MAG TPA: hypothetical protein VGX50_05280, partial [Longimicrobium sp.]|nr:hypothetical protein [Longimicrobium sp.]
AAALSACGEPTLSDHKPTPVCGDAFSEERVTPLPDSLLVIERLPALTAEQAQRLAEARAQPAAGSVVVARLAETPEPMLGLGRAFVFSVSVTRSFVLVGMERRAGQNSLSWYGWIADDNGEATLSLTSEGITGVLLSIPKDRSEPTRYWFRPLGGGLHAVICIDPSKLED